MELLLILSQGELGLKKATIYTIIVYLISSVYLFIFFTYNDGPITIKEYENQVLELGMYKNMTSFTKNDIKVWFLNG